MSVKAPSKPKPPSADTLPEAISKDAFAAAMLRLRRNPEFRMLMAQWHNIRVEILETGKSKRDSMQWATLAGFDAAIMEPEKWADYAAESEANRQGAPTSGLDGGDDD